MTAPTMFAKRYKVLSELGRGGMGTVYRVADTLHGDRELALKLIQVNGTITPELRLRFQEEFRAMSRLRHPNAVAVFDFGFLDSQTQYFTMEVVHGRSLNELIPAGLPLEQTYSLLTQLLQVLGFIHSRLYAHRDIKSENIRVGPDGSLKLMDFGLMDQLGTPSGGKITGTPGYLAPEVPRGGTVDAASDLYSVGCLAFEMLTGRLPFTGSLLEVIKAHIAQPPPELEAFRKDVPERLGEIIRKLLAKNQAARYQSAAEVLDDLVDLSGIQVQPQNLEQKQSYLISSSLVGRHRELARLQEAFGSVLKGSARSVFVGAPAGVGKSRLVSEFLLYAKLEGAIVLQGQCLEGGMSAYDPLASALRPLIPLSTPEEMAQYGRVLGCLFPELADASDPDAIGDPGDRKRALHEAVIAWIRAASARTPLVLFFDDLHWSDPRSLEAFNHCIQHMDGARLLCLATFRNDEAPASSPLWFTIEDKLTAYQPLTPFDREQIMLLLQSMLRKFTIDDAFMSLLFETTAGNVFFLTEVLRYLIEQNVLTFKEGTWHFPDEVGTLVVPANVEATITRRLDQLSAPARRMGRIAAVLGRYQDREMLLMLGDLDSDAFFATLDELVERQFLLKEEKRYTFPHDRIRETLYEEMPEAERRRIHQRCGEELERWYCGGKDVRIEELAHHFSRGEDGARAYEYLCQAASKAAAAGVLESMLGYWRQAEQILAGIDYPDKEQHLRQLWWDIGSKSFERSPQLTVEMLEKLVPVLEASLAAAPPPDPATLQRLIQAYTYLGIGYGAWGFPGKGSQSTQMALALLPVKNSLLEAAILMTDCGSLLSKGTIDLCLANAQKSGAPLFESDLTGHPPLVFQARAGASNFHSCVVFQGIRWDDAVLERTREYDRYLEGLDVFNLTEYWRGIWYAWTGRAREARQVLEEIAQNCRKNGSPPYIWALYLRPCLLYQEGAHEEAKSLILQALSYSHLEANELTKQFIHALAGFVHIELGELDKAEAMLAKAEAAGRSGPLYIVLMQALLGRAKLAMAQGDAILAREHLDEVVAMASEGPARNPLHLAVALRLMGRLAFRTGSQAEARACLERAWAIVSAPDQDNLIERGRLCLLLGDLRESQEGLVAARAAWCDAAECFHEIRNRHLLRRTSSRLEASRRKGPGVSEVQAIGPGVGNRNSLIMEKRLHLLSASTDSELFAIALDACVNTLRADEASAYLLDGSELRWVGSCDASGPRGEVPAELGHLQEACISKKACFYIEMSEAPGETLDVCPTSLLIVPVVVDDRTVAVFRLCRRDPEDPLGEAEQDQMQLLMAALTENRNGRSLYSSPVQLAEALRRSLDQISMSGGLGTGELLAALLEQYARQLRLDEVALLVNPGSPGFHHYSFPPRESLDFDSELVEQVMQSRQSICRISFPESLPAVSAFQAELHSFAVVPLENLEETLLYCVRRSVEHPVCEEDIPSFEACARVLGQLLSR